MPLVTKIVYERDALDDRMYAQGLISDVEAAQFLNRTCRSLAGLAVGGAIHPTVMFGRTYYSIADIDDLAAGRSPSERHRAYEIECRRLEGQPDEYVPQTPKEAAAQAAHVAPSGASLLARVFGKGGNR